MYIIYHKFAGYWTGNNRDNEYTDDVMKARKFNSRKEAELEICGYLERVEKIEIVNSI